MRSFNLFFYFLFFVTKVYAQYDGPFTPRSGGGLLSGHFYYQSYSQIQQQDTSQPQNLLRPVTHLSFRFLAEYGALDKLTLFVMLPVNIVSTSKELNTGADFTDTLKPGSISGLGNVEAGVKYKFYQKKWVFAASMRTELKTGTYDDGTGLRTAYDAWGIIPMLHAGRSWKEKYYVFADVGACYRTDNYSGDWRIQLEGGIRLFNTLWVRGAIHSRRSFFNGTFEKNSNLQTSLYVNNQEWLVLNARIDYQHPIGLGIQAGISGYFLGNNIATTPVFYGGIYYKWNYDYGESDSYRIERKNN